MPLQHYRQALSPGFRLFWYEIERVLGQGGFGITYQARDTNLDRSVAIKEYLPVDIARRGELGEVEPRSAGDAELYQHGMARFLVEAKTLNRFDHPNIVRVYSVFEANSTAYMVMRYEEGEALSELLERVKTLPEEQLVAMACPLLDGLEQIHAAGFIHRDVQPANIYLRRDGTPVLLDFGAAREATSGARTMTILVAPGYAPIEQYYAHGEQGPWTDIYGLAASLYRAIAGTPPIDAIERSRGILGSTRDMLVPALVAGHGRYSSSFLAAIDHALMFNEHERPPSAVEWAEELRGRSERPLLTRAPQRASTSDAAQEPGSAPHAPVALAPARAGRMRRVVRLAVLALAPVVLALALLRFGLADYLTAQFLVGHATDQPRTTLETAVAAGPDARQTAEREALDRQIAALEDEVRDLNEKLRVAELSASRAPTTPPAMTGGARVNSKSVTVAAPVQDGLEPSTPVAPRSAASSPKKSETSEASAHVASEAIHTPPTAKPTAPTDRMQEAPAAMSVAGAGHAPEAGRPGPSDTERARELMARADYSAARALLSSAATAGDADAQFLLSQLLEDARVGPVDPGAVLEWRLRAARHGLREAQVAVARAYRPGPGGLMNEPFLAYTWFVVAEQNGAIDVGQEREQVSRLLQPEQLPQALTLASALRGLATRP